VRIVEGGDHTFNVLREDRSAADQVVRETADWFLTHIGNSRK